MNIGLGNLVDANGAWLHLLHHIISAPESAPRGMRTRELLSYRSVVDMTRPVVTIAARKLDYRLLPAWAAWVLSGDGRAATIAPYCEEARRFDAPNEIFVSAYGPRIRDQIDYVTQELAHDPDSRRAVLATWRELPGTDNVMRAVALQWLIREDQLHCLATLRSSDAWAKWPYDVFNFSMVSAELVLRLRELDLPVTLGRLSMTSGSQHMYDTNWDAAKSIYAAGMPEVEGLAFTYAPLDPAVLTRPEDLRHHLWRLASGKDVPDGFLGEIRGAQEAAP